MVPGRPTAMAFSWPSGIWLLAMNSLSVATGATFLALLLGVPLAFLISKTDLIGRNLFGAVCVLPILIPPFMHAIVWSRLQEMIGRMSGLQMHSVWGAIWVLGLAYYPFVTLLTMSGLRSIDRSLEEAALLSRGKWQTLRRVSLPLTMPSHPHRSHLCFCVFDYGLWCSGHNEGECLSGGDFCAVQRLL